LRRLSEDIPQGLKPGNILDAFDVWPKGQTYICSEDFWWEVRDIGPNWEVKWGIN
jgi:hypothetical protein